MFHCIICWSHFETWHFLMTYTNTHKTLKKEKKSSSKFDFVQNWWNWCHNNYKAAESHRSHLLRCWSIVLLCQQEHFNLTSPAIRHHFQFAELLHWDFFSSSFKIRNRLKIFFFSSAWGHVIWGRNRFPQNLEKIFITTF